MSSLHIYVLYNLHFAQCTPKNQNNKGKKNVEKEENAILLKGSYWSVLKKRIFSPSNWNQLQKILLMKHMLIAQMAKFCSSFQLCSKCMCMF